MKKEDYVRITFRISNFKKRKFILIMSKQNTKRFLYNFSLAHCVIKAGI